MPVEVGGKVVFMFLKSAHFTRATLGMINENIYVNNCMQALDDRSVGRSRSMLTSASDRVLSYFTKMSVREGR